MLRSVSAVRITKALLKNTTNHSAERMADLIKKRNDKSSSIQIEKHNSFGSKRVIV